MARVSCWLPFKNQPKRGSETQLQSPYEFGLGAEDIGVHEFVAAEAMGSQARWGWFQGGFLGLA